MFLNRVILFVASDLLHFENLYLRNVFDDCVIIFWVLSVVFEGYINKIIIPTAGVWIWALMYAIKFITNWAVAALISSWRQYFHTISETA